MGFDYSAGAQAMGALGSFGTNLLNAGMTMQADASSARAFDETMQYNRESRDAARLDAHNFRVEDKAFAERMSNSAYQRGTADMRAAGINPMAAFMQGGASTPASGGGAPGASSSPSQPQRYVPRFDDIARSTMSTALEFQRLKKDIAETDSRIVTNQASAVAALANADQSNATAQNIRTGLPTTKRTAEAGGFFGNFGESGKKVGEAIINTSNVLERLPGISQQKQQSNFDKRNADHNRLLESLRDKGYK